MYNKLVLSGGSKRGILTLGSLEYIYQTHPDFISNIHTFIGTSVGAIICYLLIIGYKPAKIIAYLITNDFFNKFKNIDLVKLTNCNGSYSWNIVGKYIKNINFNIPDSKSYFLIEKNIKNYKINFDIKSKKIKENIFEIDTNLKLMSEEPVENKIEVSIIFSTLISLKEDIKNKKDLKKIVLVDVPTSIYPEIRSVLVFLFEKSGFKQISLEKTIDFHSLYEKNN